MKTDLPNILVIGAGQCGYVAAHRLVQNGHLFGNLCIASPNQNKCEDILLSIAQKGYGSSKTKKMYSSSLNAMDIFAIIKLIKDASSSIVLNLGPTCINMSVFKACLETGASYLDTALYEGQESTSEIPWYAKHEWKYLKPCEEKKLTAILGAGFCPGVSNAYCAYAVKHHFDTIDSIDIMVANDAGENFAIGNSAEVILREFIDNDVAVWINRGWTFKPILSEKKVYNFPLLGEKTIYLNEHDELHSLYKNISANNIRFWAGYSDYFVNCVRVLREIGLLSPSPVRTNDGIEVSPLKVVLACMPKPEKVNTGTRFKGVHVKGYQNHCAKEMLYYNISNHETCYKELKTNASSYVNGSASAAATLLVANGLWDIKRMVNVEELDPDPFIELLTKMGVSTEIKTLT